MSSQKQDKAKQVEQDTKASDKTKNNKKRKFYPTKRDRDWYENSTSALETNTTLIWRWVDQDQGRD